MEINLSTFIYAGLFLNNEEKEKLIKAIPNLNILLPSNHTIYCDHLTLLFKNDIYTNKGQEILDFISNTKENASIKIIIDAIGCSDKAFAFFAKKTNFLNSYCMNENPHITLATYNGGKPVDSNKINNFIALDNPIEIVGNLKVINAKYVK